MRDETPGGRPAAAFPRAPDPRCASPLTSGRSPLSMMIRSPTRSRPMIPSVSPEKSADMLRRTNIAMTDATDTMAPSPGLACRFHSQVPLTPTVNPVSNFTTKYRSNRR